MNNWKTTVLGLAALAIVAIVVYKDPTLIDSEGVKWLVGAVFGTGAALLWARDGARKRK